jgi:16S rRNA (adenine1518-N6/adenine1519-N6)-dimethyltransferase
MSTRKPVNAAHRATHPQRKARLGQNFLVDAVAARRIVEALGDIGNSVVVEIGAGPGSLTTLLAPRAAHLVATELDEMLADKLRVAYAGNQNVEVVRADFLKLSLSELLHRKIFATEKARIVGNIPYYITSDILLRLFEQNELIELAVLMVQREVGDRLVAQPGTRDYGLLTVTTQLFSDVERLFTLPPSAFFPPPQVHSSVLCLTIDPKAVKLGIEVESFLKFCKHAFAQKRKTLFNNLRGRFAEDEIRRALMSISTREDVRAEALSLESLAGIYRMLAKKASA